MQVLQPQFRAVQEAGQGDGGVRAVGGDPAQRFRVHGEPQVVLRSGQAGTAVEVDEAVVLVQRGEHRQHGRGVAGQGADGTPHRREQRGFGGTAEALSDELADVLRPQRRQVEHPVGRRRQVGRACRAPGHRAPGHHHRQARGPEHAQHQLERGRGRRVHALDTVEDEGERHVARRVREGLAQRGQ